MDNTSFVNSDIFIYVIIPFLIFIARIIDVTLQTIRILFISRGNRILAPVLGFFEVLIWLLAIRQIMQNMDNVFCYLAYGAGFAMGNLIGMIVEEKLAYGNVVIRLITRTGAQDLVDALRRKGFGATKVNAAGGKGPVHVIYSILPRQDLQRIIKVIEGYNPKAFFTVEDIRMVKEGIFPSKKGMMKMKVMTPVRILKKKKVYQRLRLYRKGK